MNSENKIDETSPLLWKQVVDKIPLRIYVKSVNDDMRYVLCNEKLRREMNLTHEDLSGKKLSEIFPPEVVECFEQTTRKTMELGGIHTEEEFDYDENGMRKDLRTTETVYTMPNGKRYIFGYCIDITEDNALMNVERTIYDISTLPIVGTDFMQNIFDVISREDRLDVEELRWQSHDWKETRTFRAPDDAENEVYKPNEEDRKKIWKIHYDNIKENGVAYYTDFTAVATTASEEFRNKGHKCLVVLPVQTRAKEPIGEFVLFFRSPRRFTKRYIDMMRILSNTLSIAKNRITALRELELQLARAEEAEKAKSFFFASVSHDIRTPLNSIIGFGELLKSDNLDDSVRRQYVDAITSSGQVLMKLINDTLDLAKLEVGKMQFEKKQTNFAKMVKEVSMTFLPQVQDKGLELKTDIESDLPFVEIDSERIRQVLINLISNAIKFTDKGTIEIAARFSAVNDTHGKFSFGVIDSGRGISEEDQKLLMQPFVQLLRTDQGRGTGLGLAICRQLVERMGGKMTIESEIGIGSLFKVEFENIRYSQTDQLKKMLSLTQRIKIMYGPKEVGNLRFLLVDDMDLNLQVLRSMLKRLGVNNLVVARSGREALDILNKDNEKFDSVLTDMWMPEMGGAELVKLIRADSRFDELPIYAVTADVDIIKTYEQQGFTGYLLKPVSLKKLSDHLAEYCQ